MSCDKRIKNVGDVAAHRLCLGCGACAPVCPEQRVTLIDVEDDGIRPVVDPGGCVDCDVCLSVCPGIQISSMPETRRDAAPGEKQGHVDKRWGPVLDVWEGYACDAEIRFQGSSGGLCTALSLFCIEQGVAGGVVHVVSDERLPLRNVTRRSTSKEELCSGVGSRYAPASPCDSFAVIEEAPEPTVFVGKPCDLAAVSRARRSRPQLSEKIALTIGFFCAGTPSTLGTLDLLRSHGIEKDAVRGLRYRGAGWPGMATVTFKDSARPPVRVSYGDSWGFLQRYRPLRCYLCPDSTAELGDISVGDPWYRENDEKEPGRSLILIRTEKGRAIFARALSTGYVAAEKVGSHVIERSQKNLLRKRQEIWGRLIALRLLGIPYPKFEGFYLFENWLGLSLRDKIRSIAGMIKRSIVRNYFKRKEVLRLPRKAKS